uniref:Uncharacterized protein n=1 Tax=Sander lucioperca TaxID=283035 RepID=A0A8C9Y1C3_SANLU
MLRLQNYLVQYRKRVSILHHCYRSDSLNCPPLSQQRDSLTQREALEHLENILTWIFMNSVVIVKKALSAKPVFC